MMMATYPFSNAELGFPNAGLREGRCPWLLAAPRRCAVHPLETESLLVLKVEHVSVAEATRRRGTWSAFPGETG